MSGAKAGTPGAGRPIRDPAAGPGAGGLKSLTRTPGSVRYSLTVLGAVGVSAVVLLGLADGMTAAATGLALITVAGLAVARYVAGADSQDSGYRKSVRLLGSQRLAVGEWQLIVRRTLGEDAEIHFGTTMRPQLQRLFAARLAEVHGIVLHRDPERAAAVIGPALWPWIDPRTGPPQPVLTGPTLHALLDRLEALSTVRPAPHHDQAQ
jgi:hypothetical protein